MSPAAPSSPSRAEQSGRPVVAVVLLAQGNEARLAAALERLRPLCAEHGVRLVVVWPGEHAPGGTERRGELFEVVLVSPMTPKTAARQAGAARALADLMMFTDDELANEAGWADLVALRLGVIRRGSTDERGDNWASILRSQGVPNSPGGY